MSVLLAVVVWMGRNVGMVNVFRGKNEQVRRLRAYLRVGCLGRFAAAF